MIDTIVMYVFIGIIWASFCIYMTVELKYKKMHWYEYIPGIMINFAFWPISMIYAIRFLRGRKRKQ